MSQTKYKWLLFLILILLISNMVIAFFLFSTDKKENKWKGKEDFAMTFYKEVGLNPQQIDRFKVMKEEYFKDMKPIWEEMRELKDSLYRNMGLLSKDSSAMVLLTLINQKNAVADQKTFQHFIKLRNMLAPAQLYKFDTSVARIINRPWGRRNRN